MDAGAGRAGIRPRVVVGIDGSSGSRAALAWALTAAGGRGADVEAVAAFPVDFYWTDAYLADPRQIEEVRADTRARAEALIDEVRRGTGRPGEPVPDVTLLVVPGAAAERLVRQADDADLLVVGSRGRSGVRSALLGSVALHCAAHAPCPVVVVHPAVPAVDAAIVVGLDDTAMSRAALREAADEAMRSGADLEVVSAFQPVNYWSDLYAVMSPPRGQLPEQAVARARQIVSDVLGEEAHRMRIRLTVTEGPAGDVLLRAAAGARLLVVGSQSRSRLGGMALGSIALHCVVAATCPVMVVHPEAAHRRHDPIPAQRAATGVAVQR
jgi:nucleotide-binding universal stress UspA family protein